MQYQVEPTGKEVSTCGGEGKDGSFYERMLVQSVLRGLGADDDGATFRRVNPHAASRGGRLAHQQNKTAEQHPCPQAGPDQGPDGEAWFSPVLQSKLRLQAHGICCV